MDEDIFKVRLIFAGFVFEIAAADFVVGACPSAAGAVGEAVVTAATASGAGVVGLVVGGFFAGGDGEAGAAIVGVGLHDQAAAGMTVGRMVAATASKSRGFSRSRQWRTRRRLMALMRQVFPRAERRRL